MTNEQILKKAIEKAIKNNGINPLSNSWQFELDNYEDRLLGNSERIRYLIFSHDFAKAFWGEKYIDGTQPQFDWQIHLSKMVLEKEPLLYLKQFLDEKTKTKSN